MAAQEDRAVDKEPQPPFSDPACVPAEWKTITVADPTGRPSAIIDYPSGWDLVPLSAGRVQLGVTGQPFQVIVSVFRGVTMNEAEVRAMDERTLGRFEVISPWEKVGQSADLGVYQVTRKTPTTSLLARYYAGYEGLILMTLELSGPIEHCVYEQYRAMNRRLVARFSP